MTRSIVFGANGYLGRHLVARLTALGHDVVSVGVEPESIDGVAKYTSLDCTNLSAIEALDFTSDYIFVFAGMTGTHVGFDQYETFLKLNDIILLNILTAARKTQNAGRIIFPSTRLVYKGLKNTPLLETAEKEAKTIYAQNKLSCEAYLEMYAQNFGVDYTTFRICVPYGNAFDAQYSYGTIGFFLKMAMAGKNISLYGDGSLKRTFSHVSDLVELMLLTLENNASVNETYNLGSNDNLSLLDAATIIARKFDVGIDFVDWPEKALILESGDTIFDDKKIINLTQYSYQKSFQNWVEGLS